MTRVGYSLSPSVLNSGFSKNSRKHSTSLSQPTLGRSGIMWQTTLKPASLARQKHSLTASTVWPLQCERGWRRGCVDDKDEGEEKREEEREREDFPYPEITRLLVSLATSS